MVEVVECVREVWCGVAVMWYDGVVSGMVVWYVGGVERLMWN